MYFAYASNGHGFVEEVLDPQVFTLPPLGKETRQVAPRNELVRRSCQQTAG